MRDVLREGRDEGLKEAEELFFDTFARMTQQERFDVREDHD